MGTAKTMSISCEKNRKKRKNKKDSEDYPYGGMVEPHDIHREQELLNKRY